MKIVYFQNLSARRTLFRGYARNKRRKDQELTAEGAEEYAKDDSKDPEWHSQAARHVQTLQIIEKLGEVEIGRG